MPDAKTLDTLAIDTIRTLSMDAVQAANSGHPGTPMALAPLAYVLWNRHLAYDPAHPHWLARDRFVLSNGHASMLLYSMIHLAGVVATDAHGQPTSAPAVSLDDIKRFRQLHSKCPGHPESHYTTGVETTTGPLGQGIANSVGMAIAERWLASTYNRPGFELFNYRVYAICGDGCLMEGISNEAASLAGHLKLSNLVWFYDNNHITIEGETSLAYSDDVARRFEGLGWNVLHVKDVNDLAALEQAIARFHATSDKPTLVITDSHIGFGAPHKQDTREAHGEPLGDAEIQGAKKAYGWPVDAKFLVPPEVPGVFKAGIQARGAKLYAEWTAKFAAYKAKFPQEAAQLEAIQKRELPAGWDQALPTFPADAKGLASRDSSGKVLNAVAKAIPWVVGGSADLYPSTKTLLTFDGAGGFQAGTYGGRNLHFGIREHGMAAAVNGMTLSGLRAYGSTFFIFSDYLRPCLRLAAIMEIPSLFIFTHDSIGVGEDGPTHQPIEQLASLRAIPGLIILRPADANEVVEAWKTIMAQTHHPVALVLTRQGLPTLDRSKVAPASGLAKGAYVLSEADGGVPQVVLIGTGSEVHLCLAAQELLKKDGIKARVVSMPSWELFEQQDKAYKDSVLPPTVTARVAVEMGATLGWERYVGLAGTVVGMTSFGASAPIKDLLKHFGFTAENVAAAAKRVLGK